MNPFQTIQREEVGTILKVTPTISPEGSAVMLKISDGMDDFALLTIPFFVLAGAIMSEGGVARRLVDLAKVFVGFIRGGLALVNVLASTLFGCLSGSSVADTASIGSVMIPQMIKSGYPRLFAVNVTITILAVSIHRIAGEFDLGTAWSVRAISSRCMHPRSGRGCDRDRRSRSLPNAPTRSCHRRTSG